MLDLLFTILPLLFFAIGYKLYNNYENTEAFIKKYNLKLNEDVILLIRLNINFFNLLNQLYFIILSLKFK